jgi:Sec-independent protein translocase protein TatA
MGTFVIIILAVIVFVLGKEKLDFVRNEISSLS